MVLYVLHSVATSNFLYRSVSEELRLSCQRVCELEAYLGGEIPQLPMKRGGRSLTWMEERDRLHGTIEVSTTTIYCVLKM